MWLRSGFRQCILFGATLEWKDDFSWGRLFRDRGECSASLDGREGRRRALVDLGRRNSKHKISYSGSGEYEDGLLARGSQEVNNT